MIFSTVSQRVRQRRFLVAGVALLAGCSGQGSTQNDYDPAAVGAAALTAFDANGDGKLADDELQACPAIQSALDRIDANQDGMLEASEISKRVAAYADMSEYIVAQVLVKLGNQPVSGAQVKLMLADYMRVQPTSFIAATDASGVGFPRSDSEGLLGFPLGFYDVEVSHAGEKWNFGVEMADDNPLANQLEFDLKDKS